MNIGSVTVNVGDLGDGACIQVPITMVDPLPNRDLRDLNFNVELSGDTDIIAGGVATMMIVANGFDGSLHPGIADPGQDLENLNPPGSPGATCPQVF